MQKSRKLLALILTLVIVAGMLSTAAYADIISPDTAPAQICVTMTEDPQHSVSITWTTIDTNLTDPAVTINGMIFSA